MDNMLSPREQRLYLPNPFHRTRSSSSVYHLARHVLVFLGYPGRVISKDEMQRRLEDFDQKFKPWYKVDDFRVCPRIPEAFLVFNMIRAAMKVMGYHKLRLFGAGFDKGPM